MRNYVIINGVNSLDIQGLAINNLPPITKPMIRTQREEIDGRDGDIVTELGYSAYDKQMEIGLYGNFDIDAIIKYFTGEGTIVFSNEEDKYYNFKILDQIDYEKLLKFKTATITFHCQPFKYSLEEEPEEAEITTITGTGENITLEDIEEAPMKIVYKGNTYQYSTSGKNLFSDVISDYTVDSSYRLRNLGTGSDTLTISFIDKDTSIDVTGISIGFSITTNPNASGYVWSLSNGVVTQNKTNITINGQQIGEKAPYIIIYPKDATTFNKIIQRYYIQVEKGTATSYEPYTNGASPNPDYPQEIQVVSGDNEINITGKNLFSGDYSQFDSTGGEGTTYGYFKLPDDGETYTLSLIAKNDFAATQYIGFSKNGGNATRGFLWLIQGNTTYTKGQKYTINNSLQGTRLDYVSIYANNSTTLEQLMDNFYIQLEKGTATSYEPYTGASYPISLGDIQLLHIPNTNYYDKIDKSSGKNLLEPNSFAQKVIDTPYSSTNVSTYDNETGELSIKIGNSGVVFDNFKENTQYTIILKYNIATNGSNLQIAYTDNTTQNITPTAGSGIFRLVTTEGKSVASIKHSAFDSTIPRILYLKESGIFEGVIETSDFEPYGTSWYLKKEIGKVVLNGSENWNTRAGETLYAYQLSNAFDGNKTNGLSTHWQFISGGAMTTQNKECMASANTNASLSVFTNNSYLNTITNFTTWLSTHNTIVYYILATPTYTEIEDSTLIEELESMKKSYENQTNISQENNDLPFELDVSVTFLTPMEINNIGNIYAKPILTIEGTGNIGVVLNDIQILDIDLTNNGKIAIDVTKLEAYNPDDDTLLNRLVTGDYMKLLINEGENTITFTGNVSGATLTNYTRWI